MAKKDRNAPDNASEGTIGKLPPPPDGVAGSDEAAQLTPRLSVQLDEHGRIAWERMRADTRDKLTAAIKASYTPSAAASGTVVESFPPAMAEVIYDSLSMLMIGLAKRGGYTSEQANVLVFNTQEKNALVPATIKVLDKYNTSLGKYQEEIMLGVLLVTITSGKIALLKKTTPVINMVRENAPAAGSQGES